jgi:hypothetical protein
MATEKIPRDKIEKGGGHFPDEKKPDRRSAKKELKLSDAKVPGAFRASKDPTTFELALLAEILSLKAGNTDSPEGAVLKALNFWTAAEWAIVAKRELTELLQGLFIIKQEEWDRRIQDYPGDKTHLSDLLNGEGDGAPRYNVETEVMPNLFTAKAETEDSRKEKLGELLRFAQEQGSDTRVFLPPARLGPLRKPSDPKPLLTADSLQGRALNVLQVRWLAQARMAQISANMDRSEGVSGRKKKPRKPEAI